MTSLGSNVGVGGMEGSHNKWLDRRWLVTDFNLMLAPLYKVLSTLYVLRYLQVLTCDIDTPKAGYIGTSNSYIIYAKTDNETKQ